MNEIFTIENKKISIYYSTSCKETVPVIYLNMYSDCNNESQNIFNLLNNMSLKPFVLVAISGLIWNKDMCPWSCPPLTKNSTPCASGADSYLEVLTKKIVLKVKELLGFETTKRCLSGYSLGGLFALYSLYKTDIFLNISSVSGSLWYPNIVDFIQRNTLKIIPNKLYFSLGDKEAKTKNIFLKNVQENTQIIYEYFKKNGINTTFVLNKGNHHANALERTVNAIAYLLR